MTGGQQTNTSSNPMFSQSHVANYPLIDFIELNKDMSMFIYSSSSLLYNVVSMHKWRYQCNYKVIILKITLKFERPVKSLLTFYFFIENFVSLRNSPTTKIILYLYFPTQSIRELKFTSHWNTSYFWVIIYLVQKCIIKHMRVKNITGHFLGYILFFLIFKNSFMKY